MNPGPADGTQTITIAAEPIELCQLLKFAGLTASGGEAKQVIAAGLVAVNGETDTRKRRKLVAGDCVTFGDHALIVALG
jgi:ribosome-associated protein